MKMTGRERTLCAINGKIPDTVPIFESNYCQPLFKHVLGYDVNTYNAYDLVKCAEKIGYDMCVVPFGGVNGFGKEGSATDSIRYQDEWGVTYQKDPAAWPTDAPIILPLVDGSDWKNYDFPDATIDSRMEGIKTAMALSKENNMAIFSNVRGPYTGAWMLFGIENFSYMMYDEPEIVHEILDKVTDFSIIGAMKAIDEGVDAVLFSDDYGSCSAPLLSPKHFNEFILPQLKKLTDAVHGRGKKLIMHSDGFIRALLDDIIGIGVNGYHPIERAAQMDIAEVKKSFPNTVLLGNINNKTTLVTGTPQEVEEEVKETIRIAAPGGGFILTSDHSIHEDTPLPNVFAMYDAGRKYGAYPINIK